MKKKIIISVLIVLVIVTIGLCFFINRNNSEVAKLQKISVSEVTRSVFYAPQYVAISQGFFEEEGIEVELTTGEGADKVMTAVLANQCDIGFAGPEASIYVYNEGKEDYAEVFAQMTKRDGSFLVSKEPTDNFSWNDLRGKTVIPGRKGGVPYMTFEYVLKKNGINPEKDLVLDDSIKFDLMAGAFSGGDAEYVTLFEPTASLTENSGKGYIVASVGEASGEIPYTAYFAKKSYISENEEIIQGFTNAIYKGQLWVQNHSAKEIAESIVGFFPNSNVDTLENAIQSYIDIDAWNETPILTEKSFNLFQDVMEEAGELEKRVEHSKIINNSYAEKAIEIVK